MNLKDKVKELKKVFAGEDKDSYQEILGWERSIEKFERLRQLEENDAVKELIADFQRVVTACDKILLHDRELTELKRAVVFEKRDNYYYFINLFKSAKKNLDALEKQVDENL